MPTRIYTTVFWRMQRTANTAKSMAKRLLQIERNVARGE